MPDEQKTETKTANGVPSTDIVVILRKPVQAHGDEVKELRFREPNAGDIEICGNPVNLDFAEGRPKMTFNEKAMSRMMSQLATVPPSTIKQMHTKDWENAAWELASFFMPDL